MYMGAPPFLCKTTHTKINKKTKLYSTHFMKNMIYSARNEKMSVNKKAKYNKIYQKQV